MYSERSNTWATLGALLIYRRGGLGWLRSALARWGRQHWTLRAASVGGLMAVAAGAAWHESGGVSISVHTQHHRRTTGWPIGARGEPANSRITTAAPSVERFSTSFCGNPTIMSCERLKLK